MTLDIQHSAISLIK